jgi:hypothetical protein
MLPVQSSFTGQYGKVKAASGGVRRRWPCWKLLVEGVYRQFDEGFNHADLLEAKWFVEGG